MRFTWESARLPVAVKLLKGLGEFPPNFRKVGAGGRAQRVGRGLSQGSLRPLIPWGASLPSPPDFRVPPPAPPTPAFLFLPRPLSLPPTPYRLALPSAPLALPPLTWPELTVRSSTRGGGPRPGPGCGRVPGRETKLKLTVLGQLPSQLRDTEEHGLRPRLLPHPARTSSRGAPPPPERGPLPEAPGSAAPSQPPDLLRELSMFVPLRGRH